ncbi:hypothetical protein [Actinoallomurus sp. CA-150999]|uniref:hypothetical protein n=1 Tax=Actinoallomurus sp. CA-150999 TaxID=3239887 RepID=UPI003D95081C
MRYARTLVEAYLYFDLAAAESGAAGDVRARTTLTEGQDAWTLRFGGADDAGQGDDADQAGQGGNRILDALQGDDADQAGQSQGNRILDALQGHDAGRDRSAPIEVRVRHSTEEAARRRGLRFGSDTSELIDAGQWIQLSTVYARRALRDGIAYAQDPSEERHRAVVADWEFARDTAIEAAKHLPEDADEIPDEAIWTPLGAETRRAAPDRFTRDRLDRDIAFYQQSLEDARRQRGGAA